MKGYPLNKSILTAIFVGVDTVTREMVYARTRELALLAGYAAPHVRQSDYEQAKRELTGETDMDRQDAMLDALPGENRWNPVPGAAAHLMRESSSEDEDAEGRNETKQLMDGGAMEAGCGRQRQAAQAVARTAPAEG
jgi:hypothetical protein